MMAKKNHDHDHDEHAEGEHSAHDHDEEHEGHGGGHEEGAHGEGEPWLVSYADMMTLLFGFFVVLYNLEASKAKDDANTIRIKKELAKYFGGTYVSPTEEIGEKLMKKVVADLALKSSMKVEITPDGLKINLMSAVLFDPGSAEFLPQAASVLGDLSLLLLESKDKIKVTVEGHTDDSPISNQRFPSNWELSAARASRVVRLFAAGGFPEEKLSAVGLSSTHPVMPNRGPTGEPIRINQSKNRRVVIRVVNDFEETITPPVTEVDPHADPHGH